LARFLLTAVGFALALPFITRFAFEQCWIARTPSYLHETTWLVALTTGILFIYLYRSEKGQHFVQFYLASVVVKLIAYLAYTLLIILNDRSGAGPNVVYFLIVYAVFTAAEIGFLYRKISPR
jgi:hypothetical protein